MRVIKTLSIALCAAMLAVGCCGTTCNNNTTKTSETMETTKKFQKKYTNADYYKDGVFQEAVAIEAMKELIAFYGYPFTEFMEGNFWVAEFGLGDFENVGMGGIFWVNDKEHGYFAHTIYLLPGQMIPEHAHFPTDAPAKFESWMMSKGWCYNFSEVGEATPNAPQIPASHGPVKSKNFTIQNVGEILPLKQIETYHFLMAGDEGAIVEEWASFHDNGGLRFTNSVAKL
ncbi:MAG: hypothetical protein R3Y68_05755 [Rikenellaceae bacterium]